MSEIPKSLNALSEMIALSSYGNTKNLIVTAVTVEGRIDESRMISAAKKAATKYPLFAGKLAEIRRGAKRLLMWNQSPIAEIPVFVSELKTETSRNALDDFLRHLEPRLDRDWNLFEEAPAEIHLVGLSDGTYIVAPTIHHAIADGGTASEFGRELLANYHELMTGEPPHWNREQHPLSSTKKRMVEVKRGSFKDLITEAREAMTHMREKPTLPIGHGIAGDNRQFHIKRLLSEEESTRILGGSLKRGVSPVDLLAACTNMAIDRWNDSMNVSPGLLTTSISVNMRGRFRGFEGGNTSGLIFFKSTPDERKDFRTYARSIAVRRIRHFRDQMDMTFFQNVSKMTGITKTLPFKLRRKVTNLIMNSHEFSAAVTFLGIIWPVMKNGRPSADSSPTELAGIPIGEVHGIGYKLLSNTRILLISYLYRNRLNLILAASASLFTREEAESFMDLILSNLVRNAVESE